MLWRDFGNLSFYREEGYVGEDNLTKGVERPSLRVAFFSTFAQLFGSFMFKVAFAVENTQVIGFF